MAILKNRSGSFMGHMGKTTKFGFNLNLERMPTGGGDAFLAKVKSCDNNARRMITVTKTTGNWAQNNVTQETTDYIAISQSDYSRVGDYGLAVVIPDVDDIDVVFIPFIKFGLVEPPTDNGFTGVASTELATYQDLSDPEECTN